MKIKVISIAALVATILFASCNRDNISNGHEENGKPTFMSVSINHLADIKTRSITGDPNATDIETEMHTVDIFVYYTRSGTFESHTHLKGHDFDIIPSNNGEAGDTEYILD